MRRDPADCLGCVTRSSANMFVVREAGGLCRANPSCSHTPAKITEPLDARLQNSRVILMVLGRMFVEEPCALGHKTQQYRDSVSEGWRSSAIFRCMQTKSTYDTFRSLMKRKVPIRSQGGPQCLGRGLEHGQSMLEV